jgi:hypothetical protein
MRTKYPLEKISLAHFWATLAAILLAVGWLLPNHSLPWTTFHADAWVAAVLGMIGVVVLFKSMEEIRFYVINLLSGLIVLIPLGQFAFGLLPFAGQAFVVALYMLGFLFAQAIGQQWQKWRPIWLGNILFAAIGIASIASVGLQLYQWLGLTRGSGMTDIWIIGLGGVRPYANLGQPNQLATLLLWGLLACAWGVWRGYLGRVGATLIAAFLLAGLALTQSRSGMLGLCVVISAPWWCLPFKKNTQFRWFSAGLGAFYFLILWSVRPLSRFFLLEDSINFLDSSSGEIRLSAWRMLLDAIALQPWTGYGFNEVMAAHLTVAERHPDVGQLFGQSHNLFLDFFVWAGIPLGISISLSLLAWLVVAVRRIANIPDAIYFLMVIVVSVHSMLEFPLHYAYFLLPVGVFVGVLNESLKLWPLGLAGLMERRIILVFYLVVLVFFGLLVRDYFRVEESSNAIRFEKAHVKAKAPAQPPDVFLLTHMHAQLAFFLMEPSTGVSKEELDRARELTTSFPSYHNLMKLITLLALNDCMDDVRWWMIKMPYIMDVESQRSIPERWKQIQNTFPSLKSLEWIESDLKGEPKKIQGTLESNVLDLPSVVGRSRVD